MGRKRTPMSEGKKNIISMLFEEYNIETAEDIENAPKAPQYDEDEDDAEEETVN